MNIYDVNVDNLQKGLQVQFSHELKTVRFGFESETSDGKYLGVILTMNEQTARDLALALIKATDSI